MRRTLFLGLAAATLVMGSGCCHSFRSFVYSPFGPGTLCDPRYCGGCGECDPCGEPAACDEGCGCGTIGRRHAVAIESDCGPTCDGCAGHGCDHYGYPTGPLTWVFEIFNPRCWDGGCGERYWGDFHGDPPDCRDPCDRSGNWTGGPCAGCGITSESCADCGTTGGSGSYGRVIPLETSDRALGPTRDDSGGAPASPEPIEDPYASRRVPTRARR
ncbi:MAG: hypothetical protein JW809_16650 [Pirellulales bacterium]|nr:hypothetical protein [Pirellulales bacterium]